jgi:hypothetical protein
MPVLSSSLPADVKAFDDASRVTFFYGMRQSGRVLRTQARWISPPGIVVKTTEQTVDQMGQPGTWTWRTQPAPSEISLPGRWSVELVIEGHPVGTYGFELLKGPVRH